MLHWTQQIGCWLGRVYSVCSTRLVELIHHVIRAIYGCFSKTSQEQQSPLPITRSNNIEEGNIKEQDNTPADASLLFSEENEEELEEEPNVDLSFFSSEEEQCLEQKEDLSPKKEEAMLALPETGSELFNLPKQTARFYQFSRYRRRYEKYPLKAWSETPKPSCIPTQTVASHEKKLDPVASKNQRIPKIIECGGQGNCQLLSILKGLEKQYMHLLKPIPFTAQKLRHMGVEFARQQIDQRGAYAQDILGYLDSDRQEYNSSLTHVIDLLEKEMAKNETALKHKTISPAQHAQQKKRLQEKYSKSITHVEKSLIHTDKEFLQHLEKDGFWCSTIHLFTLSILLELPIHVKQGAEGVKGHDVQEFNPTDSTKEPIHLYRTQSHYQYLFYS